MIITYLTIESIKMAKKSATNSVANTEANRKARRTRHAKSQPNDVQSIAHAKLSGRCKPRVKGNFPAANTSKMYRDLNTGQPLKRPAQY